MTSRDPEEARGPGDATPREHDRKIERLLAEAEAATGPTAWPRVEALVSAVVDLYGAGLERMLACARASVESREELDERLVRDDLLSSLLLLHDLHPVPLEERLTRALARVERESPAPVAANGGRRACGGARGPGARRCARRRRRRERDGRAHRAGAAEARGSAMIALGSLERFTRRARVGRAGARCEICAAAIDEDGHRHVVDLTDRRLLCACGACVIAFSFSGDAPGRLRSVPERVRALPEGSLGDDDLAALGVPVGLAFIFRPSTDGRCVAVYPSPAGPTEAELPGEALRALAAKNAIVREMEDDVEALLVRRRRDGRRDCFVVPIDVCYSLTALVRERWEGIDGGDAARAALDAFFDSLATRSREGGRR